MKIGNLQLESGAFLAPLCGITTRPFRKLCREFGASIVYTETVSSDGLGMLQAKTLDLARFSDEERPMGVQIFGCDPRKIAYAARIAQDFAGPDVIDLNFGCPVPKFVKNDKGAALLKDPCRIEQIVRETRKVTDVPLTAKMRTGWDEKSIAVKEITSILEGEGVDAITIHGRTRVQGYSGEANWERIREAVDNVKVPVIGNGDVRDGATAELRMKETGCAAVMIGRGAIGNPWVFQEVAAVLAGKEPTGRPGAAERLEVVLRHLELQIEDRGVRRGIPEFRRHLSAYTKGIEGGAAFRNEANHVTDLDHLEDLIHSFFGAAPRGSSHAA